MVIFHSYVSLPEGTPIFLHLEKYEFVNGKDYHIYVYIYIYIHIYI